MKWEMSTILKQWLAILRQAEVHWVSQKYQVNINSISKAKWILITEK